MATSSSSSFWLSRLPHAPFLPSVSLLSTLLPPLCSLAHHCGDVPLPPSRRRRHRPLPSHRVLAAFLHCGTEEMLNPVYSTDTCRLFGADSAVFTADQEAKIRPVFASCGEIRRICLRTKVSGSTHLSASLQLGARPPCLPHAPPPCPTFALCVSAAFGAKALPLPCVLLLPRGRRQCLCLVVSPCRAATSVLDPPPPSVTAPSCCAGCTQAVLVPDHLQGPTRQSDARLSTPPPAPCLCRTLHQHPDSPPLFPGGKRGGSQKQRKDGVEEVHRRRRCRTRRSLGPAGRRTGCWSRMYWLRTQPTSRS